MLLHWKERHADAVPSRLRQGKTQFLAFPRKKLVWDLDQNPGAVSGFRIAAARAAMRQVEQHLDTFTDNFVTFLSGDAGHKPDSTGVMLVRRVV
jgi:hypothetical protein